MSDEPIPIEALLTLDDVAAILRKSARSTRRLHALGKLPEAMRIGVTLRWRRETIDEFLRDGALLPRRKQR